MKDQDEISNWIVSQISQLLMISEDEISIGENFFELGIDSQDSMVLIARIESELGLSLDHGVMDEFDTIQKLSELISQSLVEEV